MNTAPLEVEEVHDPQVDLRIRWFRAGEEVDTFVVSTQRFVLFVDTMSTPALMRQVINAVRADLNSRPVMVLNTHADWDHVYGNQLFSAHGELPAVIFTSDLTHERLLGEVARDRLKTQQAAEGRFAEVVLTAPQVTFPGTFSLQGGNLTVEVFPTPGHTSDHVSAWIPELRTLLAGDAAEYPFPNVTRAAQLPEALSSLERLRAFEPEVLLTCHGGLTTPEVLNWNIQYFSDLHKHLQSLPDPATWLDRPREAARSAGVAFDTILAEMGTSRDRVPNFYEAFHDDAVRATLEKLSQRP